jgi:NAD(P)-dependent dehydrogenase (short-subunit alcohol dehydrogenase family)
MGTLSGRVALVTGGARGQGRSHALALAKEGAHVAVCDIGAPVSSIKYDMATAEQLQESVKLIEEHDVRALGLVADLRDTHQVQSVVDQVIAEFGRIDILVANHGVVAFSTVENTSDDEWNSVVDTNLTAIFKTFRAVIPHMKKNSFGRIVATSSSGARIPHPNLAHYVASKWGVIGLSKATALEVGKDGITVNVVCPAGVQTDLFFNQPTFDIFCPDIEHPTREDFERRLVENNAGLNGRRYLQPEHVSRAVMHFVNDEDGVLNGQVLDIGLGLSATGIY